MYRDLRKHLPNNPRRQKIAELILHHFDRHDADDWDEGSELWRDSGRPVYQPGDDE